MILSNIVTAKDFLPALEPLIDGAYGILGAALIAVLVILGVVKWVKK